MFTIKFLYSGKKKKFKISMNKNLRELREKLKIEKEDEFMDGEDCCINYSDEEEYPLEEYFGYKEKVNDPDVIKEFSISKEENTIKIVKEESRKGEIKEIKETKEIKEIKGIKEIKKEEENKNESKEEIPKEEAPKTEIKNEVKIKNEEEKIDKIKKKTKTPNGEGIIFPNEDEDDIFTQNLIHIDIKSSISTLEVYNLKDEEQKGYKFINFKDNRYFAICPIYINENPVIKFGIRKSDDKKAINEEDNIIEILDKNMSFDNNSDLGGVEIFQHKNINGIFNIFNEPELKDKNDIFLYLQKLHEIDYYECNINYVRKATYSLNYEEIIEKIMDIGIENKLTSKLIIILKEKFVDIHKAAIYLEKNRNKYESSYFTKIAPKIIKKLNEISEYMDEEEDLYDNNYPNKQWLLCCDKNIPKSNKEKKCDDNLIYNIKKNLGKEDFTKEDFQKALCINIDDDFILTFEYLEKIINLGKEKVESLNLPFEMFKKIHEFGNNITEECVLTLKTLNKLNELDILINANIPIIIQGFTSAGKSYLSRIALKINKRKYESEVLSESINQESLLGKDLIDENDLITFYPGIILDAYTEGKVVILDECDLAKPEILSCIIGTLSKKELIISNVTYYKNDNYNVILTMNGEAKGFNEMQRNILPSHIITKFYLLHFDEIEEKESENIFNKQLISCQYYKKFENVQQILVDLHKKMSKMSEEKQGRIDPIVTLRNLVNCTYLDKSRIHPRIAAEISYIARFPKEERNKFEDIIKRFGGLTLELNKVEKIEKILQEKNIVYDKEINFENNSYFRAIYLGLSACEEGFHPLLVGKEGCGLTQLSEIIASLYNNSSGENNYEFLLFNGDTSEEDLLGYYQPKSNKNKVDNEIHQLSSLINWNKGPVYNAIEKGIPVILDDLGYAKSQILESLNSILETNIKYKYNEFKFKVLQQNRNDLKIEKGSKFTVIGTIKEEHLKYISKALINRFVVIYVDEIKINENNIENYDIVNKTITNLNFNIELLKKMTYETNDNNIHFIKQINPNISQYLISLLKSKKINLNIKYTVKLIEKLCLIYQKFNCRISLEDCYSLLELFEMTRMKQKL